VTSRIDESFLHLRITLADPVPDQLTIGLDILPDLSGDPPPGSGDRRPDTAFVLALNERTGQSWIRATLDPLTLDYAVPPEARGPAVGGWLQYELVTNREYVVPVTGVHHPIELFNAGRLGYGTLDPAAPDADSRALWYRDGSDVDIRIPWALAGFSDPSSLRVLLPAEGAGATAASPGVTVVLFAHGVDQSATPVVWEAWQRVNYVERLKPGADVLRTAFVDTAG
jgi:hypothetical protein